MPLIVQTLVVSPNNSAPKDPTKHYVVKYTCAVVSK